jgi:hypothetical protein
MKSSLGMSGKLDTQLIRSPAPHKARSIRVPGGRVLFTRDKGDSNLFSSEYFSTNLFAVHRDGDGAVKEEYELGSGLVTNVGVNLMANDFTWAAGATLKQMNYHAIGTGTTGAAATDYYLQTANGSSNLSGTTNGYMAGTQSYTSPNVYKTIATFTATGSISVTEWGLFNSNAANFSGTATATSSTSLTNSGASFTTTGNGLQAWSVEANASAINTPTTTAMGQVASNTGTALTLLGGWLTLANAGASTPSGTTAYVVYPSMWDHKVFSVISMVSGDTLQVTYSLTINSGG